MIPADRLRLRDALLEALRVRAGHELTEMVIQDRANNGVAYLEPVVDDIVTAALKDAARGEVVTGTIEPIGVVRAPRQNPGEPCTKTKWCGDVDGHSGDCIPPF